MKKFAIRVPFPKAEAVSKIKDRFRDFICEEFYGEIKISYPISYQNGFAPHLYLTFRESDHETTIDGRVKMKTGVRIFCFFWFSFTVLPSISFLISISGEISRGEKSFSELNLLVYPVAMILFMLGLIKYGAFIARNNTKAILDMFFSTFPNHTILENAK